MDFVKNFSNRLKVNMFAVVFIIATFICNYLCNVVIDANYYKSLLILSVIFFLLVNYFVKFFNDPVQEIIKSIDNYSTNKKAEFVVYDAKDEFGQLVRIFNNFLAFVENNERVLTILIKTMNLLAKLDDQKLIYQNLLKGIKQILNVKYVALAIFDENSTKAKEFYQEGLTDEEVKNRKISRRERVTRIYTSN